MNGRRVILGLAILGALLLALTVFHRPAHQPATAGVRVGGTVAASPTTPAEGVPDPDPSTPVPTHTHTGTDAAHTTKVDSRWLSTAHRFAVAYQHTKGVPAAQWHKQVAALCTPSLAAGFAYTDPARIPAGTVGKATVAVAFDTGGGIARVQVGHGRSLAVTVSPAGHGYRVASVDEG